MLFEMQKMKKKLWISLLLIFTIWIITGDLFLSTENRPIKKIKETRCLYLFGKRNIFDVRKYETLYDNKGKLIEHIFYNGDEISERISYSYTKFDSLEKTVTLQKIIRLETNLLMPTKVEIWIYDSLKRKNQNLVYYCNVSKGDSTLDEKTTWEYDDKNRIKKTTLETFTGSFPTIYITVSHYNSKGLLSADSMIEQCNTKEVKYQELNINEYLYDNQGFNVTTIQKGSTYGNDTIYYKRNIRGQILEQRSVKLGTVDKFLYDESGNKIESYIDYEGGHTYKFIYDKYNRIVKEIYPRGFLFIINGGSRYEYEYY